VTAPNARDGFARRWRDRKRRADRKLAELEEAEIFGVKLWRKLAGKPWPVNPDEAELRPITAAWEDDGGARRRNASPQVHARLRLGSSLARGRRDAEQERGRALHQLKRLVGLPEGAAELGKRFVLAQLSARRSSKGPVQTAESNFLSTGVRMESDVDWNAAYKVAAVVATSAAGVYQFRNSVGPRARTNLKTDLEVLKQLDPAEPSHAVVKARIERDVGRIYGREPWYGRKGLRALPVSLAFLGWGIGLTVFALANHWAWWWYLIAAYLTFGGAMFFLQGPQFASRAEREVEGPRPS
jgi:hypothetical protein